MVVALGYLRSPCGGTLLRPTSKLCFSQPVNRAYLVLGQSEETPPSSRHLLRQKKSWDQRLVWDVRYCFVNALLPALQQACLDFIISASHHLCSSFTPAADGCLVVSDRGQIEHYKVDRHPSSSTGFKFGIQDGLRYASIDEVGEILVRGWRQ